jgi:cytosine/uracil/thiamine/allantoin permease
MGNGLQVASTVADESLKELAEIDLEEISDFELRPARIFIGLSFVGFGALIVLVLVLYLNTLHPELNTVGQIRQYWYQYIWFVSLGIAGMFLLGREAMRPHHEESKVKK